MTTLLQISCLVDDQHPVRATQALQDELSTSARTCPSSHVTFEELREPGVEVVFA
ncbi:hypothetical protein [Micromonospora marina]|uniref:hypothetical protein n=1 Tax=Micromonospora marina TaxID=307120 RepID=UPI003D747426